MAIAESNFHKNEYDFLFSGRLSILTKVFHFIFFYRIVLKLNGRASVNTLTGHACDVIKGREEAHSIKEKSFLTK